VVGVGVGTKQWGVGTKEGGWVTCGWRGGSKIGGGRRGWGWWGGKVAGISPFWSQETKFGVNRSMECHPLWFAHRVYTT